MSACPRAVRPDPPGGEQHVTVVSAASGQAHTFAERARGGAVRRARGVAHGSRRFHRRDGGAACVGSIWQHGGQEAAGGRAFSGPVCCSAAAGKLDA
jgi:hypothetical protein